ncbi:cytochrome b-c1 complex subunit 6 family protein [Rhodotorula paludigena]|uniref:cytochrome b-c1 complex subunit 6 family protein n=1 Tax=Rhodotorula paludigena TaxID=86838 RepID=UPI0031799D61
MSFFASVVESVFGTVHAEQTQPESRAHDEDRSNTSTATIDDPEEAKQHKAELGEKQDEADGAEDEEEEEVPDQGDEIREACGQTKVCHEFKHHLEECGERLAAGKTIVDNETCVEELFHYMHCVEDCAAPKIFAALK